MANASDILILLLYWGILFFVKFELELKAYAV